MNEWQALDLRALIERNPDGIAVVDATGAIRFVNRAATQLFGREESALVGEEFGFPTVAGDDAPEMEIVRPGGTLVSVELRVVEIEWTGEPAFLVSLRDITDRKLAEKNARELIRANAARKEAEATAQRTTALAERAEMANRAKANFLAVMSHELRTPLNAIAGYTDLLDVELAGPVTARQRAYLRRIRQSSDHLLHLVDQVLSYARMEAGREELRIEPVDLCELARDAVALVQPQADAKKLKFRTCVPERSVLLRTDPAKLRQILLHLLSNAVKFTDRGSVELHAAADHDQAVLRVCDTGIGIPPEHQERIFDAFWQVEQTTTRPAEGTGLGLSVARQMATLLGGDIALQSEAEKGSTFTVRLPLSPPLDRGDPLADVEHAEERRRDYLSRKKADE